MAKRLDGEEPRAGSRLLPVIGLLLLILGAVLLLLVRSYLYVLEFTMSSWLLVIGCILMVVGGAVWLKYGSLGKSAGKEATGILIKALVLGMGLILLGFVLIFALVVQLPMEQRSLFFFFSFGLILAGFIVAVAGRIMFEMKKGRTRFVSRSGIMESFQLIKPEKTFQTKNFTVMKKGDIYILASKLLNAVYFVKLFDQIPVHEKGVRLPNMFFRKSQFKDEIGGLPVDKSKGEIMIPVDFAKRSDKRLEEKYVKGTGISYLIPIYEQQQKDLSGEFGKTAILQVMEKISTENNRDEE